MPHQNMLNKYGTVQIGHSGINSSHGVINFTPPVMIRLIGKYRNWKNKIAHKIIMRSFFVITYVLDRFLVLLTPHQFRD
jgi:hypothetical protein